MSPPSFYRKYVNLYDLWAFFDKSGLNVIKYTMYPKDGYVERKALIMDKNVFEDAKMMGSGEIRYKCPCCGCYTFKKKPSGDFDICPVCFWEDDWKQFDDEELEGGANSVSLRQARENYKTFGCCEERFKGNVRKPTDEEIG